MNDKPLDTPRCASCGYVESHDPNCPRPPRTTDDLADAIEQTVKGTQFEPEFSDVEWMTIVKALRAFASSETKAIAEVAAERKRQIEAEGWDAEHDDQHDTGGLALAAACYASLAAVQASERTPLDVYAKSESPFRWPWERKWWKPKNPRRDLIRAAALIVAEIERLDRKEAGCG